MSSETINSEKSRGDRREQNDQVERELREQTVDNNRLSMSRFGQKSTCPPRKKVPVRLWHLATVAAQQGGPEGHVPPLTLLEGAPTLCVPPSEKVSHHNFQW
jgi:hypothetical protein